mmetsp:Transcript_48220/g.136995  ORF Transcript_48220/g.136995 Transcript_48220/m.136995 type:complete len:265 (-) Transcript_48220:582-1376(-)
MKLLALQQASYVEVHLVHISVQVQENCHIDVCVVEHLLEASNARETQKLTSAIVARQAHIAAALYAYGEEVQASESLAVVGLQIVAHVRHEFCVNLVDRRVGHATDHLVGVHQSNTRLELHVPQWHPKVPDLVDAWDGAVPIPVGSVGKHQVHARLHALIVGCWHALQRDAQERRTVLLQSDLLHQSDVPHARLQEQGLVTPTWVGLAELHTDPVVLPAEQHVHVQEAQVLPCPSVCHLRFPAIAVASRGRPWTPIGKVAIGHQ